MSNSVDPDETAHKSRLIWIYAICKSLLLSPVAVKELIRMRLCTSRWLLSLHICCPKFKIRRDFSTKVCWYFSYLFKKTCVWVLLMSTHNVNFLKTYVFMIYRLIWGYVITVLEYTEETICMKCQILFSGTNDKKNISKRLLLKYLDSILSANACQLLLSGHNERMNE